MPGGPDGMGVVAQPLAGGDQRGRSLATLLFPGRKGGATDRAPRCGQAVGPERTAGVMSTVPRPTSAGLATGISRRCATAYGIETCNCSLTTEDPLGREGLAGWRKRAIKPLWLSRRTGPQCRPARAGGARIESRFCFRVSFFI